MDLEHYYPCIGDVMYTCANESYDVSDKRRPKEGSTDHMIRRSCTAVSGRACVSYHALAEV